MKNEKLKFWILDCHFAFCSLNFELKNDMETRKAEVGNVAVALPSPICTLVGEPCDLKK